MIYHAVPNLTYGSIGLTTAAGNDVRTGRVFSVGAPIVGPFEDGFDASTTYLQTLGCSDADLSAVTVAPGIDVHTAERIWLLVSVALTCRARKVPRTLASSTSAATTRKPTFKATVLEALSWRRWRPCLAISIAIGSRHTCERHTRCFSTPHTATRAGR